MLQIGPMKPLDRQATYTGTTEVAPALAFDAARLEQYLRERLKGFAGPLQVQQFKGGQSNPTYLLITPGRRYVLRRKPPGKLLPSAHAVDREFRAISALHPRGFPVPEPLLLCEDDGVIGTTFYVMGYADGRVFWDPHMPNSSPAERAAVYRSMGETIARLHSFDPAEIGLADYGKGEDYMARQVARWTKQYVASKTQEISEMDQLAAWLPEHLPKQSVVRVVHGDYRLDNMIIAKDRPDVIAVIDWELSTLGDPLADFTYHLMPWEMPNAGGFASLFERDLNSLGIPSRDQYVDAYVERTGLDPRASIDVYMAYNFFRLAAIVQGVVGRVRDGTAANVHAALRADAVRPLAATAARFARRAGMA
ncbi:MAG TPA: phosphotransferase family protein [Xanthobacteraceae bacterium]|jgi:aminoglycoside phosphotransferase (APT) family kinase protein